MNSIIALSYLLMLGVLVHFIKTSHIIMRKLTLSRNTAWLQDNPEFLQKHHKAPMWPLYLSATPIFGMIVFGAIVDSYSVLFWTRLAGMGGVLGVVCTIYGLYEKQLLDKIPPSTERYASLLPKTIADYTSKKVARFAYGSIALLAVAYIASFLLKGITPATFAGNIVMMLLIDGGCILSIRHIIRERIPAAGRMQKGQHPDLGKLYKITYIQLMTLVLIFYSVLALTELIFECQGYMIPSPLADWWFTLLKEPHPLQPLVPQAYWDIVVTLVLLPLFLMLTNSKLVKAVKTGTTGSVTNDL